MNPGKPTQQSNVSLARALSKLGLTSRKQAEGMITAGRVKVNGRIVRNPSFRCSMKTDRIQVDGEKVQIKKSRYIMLNKPVGVLTTRADEKGRKTVYDILGDPGRWIFPVGRLDKDTSGLLLLTNDNRLGERLTNPASKVSKTYLVRLDKPLLREHFEEFERGMVLKGEKLLPVQVKLTKGTSLMITLLEGKNRQIRRMCEAFGYEVCSLERIKIGAYENRELQPGEWKELTKEEVQRLLG